MSRELTFLGEKQREAPQPCSSTMHLADALASRKAALQEIVTGNY